MGAERSGQDRPVLSRRRLLGGSAAALGALGIGATGAAAMSARDDDAVTGGRTVPWDGVHQAGVATPAQAHALFLGLDLAPGVGRDEVIGIMRVWTEDISRLTGGGPALADTEPELATSPSRLTVTVGYGPGVFTAIDRPDARPAWLTELPAFSIDRLDPAFCSGDLLLQICSDDQVAVAHAARVLLKNVRSLTTVRWAQRGFRRAHGAEAAGTTMRNLMGQVDGTVNPSPTEADFDGLVWDDGSAQPWLAGGTSMVIRRIRIEMDTWDELDRRAGRSPSDGDSTPERRSPARPNTTRPISTPPTASGFRSSPPDRTSPARITQLRVNASFAARTTTTTHPGRAKYRTRASSSSRSNATSPRSSCPSNEDLRTSTHSTSGPPPSARQCSQCFPASGTSVISVNRCSEGSAGVDVDAGVREKSRHTTCS